MDTAYGFQLPPPPLQNKPKIAGFSFGSGVRYLHESATFVQMFFFGNAATDSS